jgi:hypothetical protein
MLLYFGLDCEMLEFFTHEPKSKEQSMSLPLFWSMVRRKRSRFEHMQTVIQNKQEVGFIFAWSGSELWTFWK